MPNSNGSSRTRFIEVPAELALPAVIRMADVLRILDERLLVANSNFDQASAAEIEMGIASALADLAKVAGALADAYYHEISASARSYIEREVGDPLDQPS